ncbi:MAG: hypothetical protein K6G83_09510 [Lachnospiraceae bacterium]|nr:hypothetical protein [Lachnospiraceae bacterium]
MAKDLQYFMRASAKEHEIIEVPGLDTIVDKDGKPVPFKIKVLHQDEITKIYDKYKTRKLLYDKKGKPVVANGKAVYSEETDGQKALNRIVVEALVYPDLKDKELMEFFDCHAYDEMPSKVFPTGKEYLAVQNMVMDALGMSGNEDEDSEGEIAEAKN